MIGRGYCTCVYRKPKRERNDGFGAVRPFRRNLFSLWLAILNFTAPEPNRR